MGSKKKIPVLYIHIWIQLDETFLKIPTSTPSDDMFFLASNDATVHDGTSSNTFSPQILQYQKNNKMKQYNKISDFERYKCTYFYFIFIIGYFGMLEKN